MALTRIQAAKLTTLLALGSEMAAVEARGYRVAQLSVWSVDTKRVARRAETQSMPLFGTRTLAAS